MQNMLYRDKRPLWIFLTVPLLMFAVFLYYPFFMNIYNSLFEIRNLAGVREEFVGVGNYVRMLSDPQMGVAMKNSLWLMVLVVVFQLGIALVLALLVDSIRRGAYFFRTVYFFPIVISATAIGLMFNLFYDYYNGMLNQLLNMMDMAPVFWKAKGSAFYAMIVPIIWQYVGFYFVILITGLSGIPADVYESAALDGAVGIKKTWYITLPLMRGVLATCTTLCITGALKVFDMPEIIVRRGAPSGTTFLLGTLMQITTFEAGNVDYGSAIAVVIVLVGVVIAQVVGKLLDRGEAL